MCICGEHMIFKHFMDQWKSLSLRWKSMAGQLGGNLKPGWGCFQKIGLPQNGCWKNDGKDPPKKMDDGTGMYWVPFFLETPVWNSANCKLADRRFHRLDDARFGFREWETPQWPERALVWVYWGLFGHGSILGIPPPRTLSNIPWKLMVGRWFIVNLKRLPCNRGRIRRFPGSHRWIWILRQATSRWQVRIGSKLGITWLCESLVYLRFLIEIPAGSLEVRRLWVWSLQIWRRQNFGSWAVFKWLHCNKT